ncbi:hypothetical protein JCM16303_006417 [Sporobolomyces ruberrimus]
MAFQHPQTRRTRVAPAITSYSPRDQGIDGDLERSTEEGLAGESGVLLFGPFSHSGGGGSDSEGEGGGDWTSLSPPLQVPRRSHSNSHASNSTTTSSSTDLEGDYSMLPSHDGNGVFVRRSTGVESLRDTSSEASDASEGGEVLQQQRERRPSHDSTAYSIASSLGGEDGGWALTEAALSSMTNSHATRRIRNHAIFDTEDEAELSAGFTSGSENEGSEKLGEGGRRKSRGEKAGFDQEVGQSVSALSAGIGSSRRRKGGGGGSGSHLISASRSPSNRNRLALAPVVGSVQRSLSPSCLSAARSQTSSDGHFSIGSNGQRLYKSKRRHRQAAGREQEGGTSASHKRFESGKFERIEEEERLRAERMKSVLEERLRENQIEKAKDEIFMGKLSTSCPRSRNSYGALIVPVADDAGDLACKVMDLDPTTLPLLAIDDPTPTPSRASSPPLLFAHIARRELSGSSFDSIGESYSQAKAFDDEEEDEGNLTETEQEIPTSSTSVPATEWIHSSSPPVFAPRSPPPPSTTSNTFPRSRSSIPPIPSFAIPFSSSRSRSLSVTSSLTSPRFNNIPLPLSRSYTSPSAQPSASETQHTHLSHEERILLSSSSSSAAPWGGELDSSFELAMSVFKRFLKRFTSSRLASATTTSVPSSPNMSPGTGGGETRWGMDTRDGSGSEVGVH